MEEQALALSPGAGACPAARGGERMTSLLEGKTALIFGVANDHSIAWGIAKAMHDHGARMAFSYAVESLERRVRPLAESVGATFVEPCDVTNDEQIDALFRRAAVPLMKNGGSVLALTYYGSEKVMPNYNVMGVAKAALEASVRYLAADLGPQGIRVNAISAGPIRTLSAAGVAGFKRMHREFAMLTPLRRNITLEDLGQTAVWLSSDMAGAITGEVVFVDSGYNILGALIPPEDSSGESGSS